MTATKNIHRKRRTQSFKNEKCRIIQLIQSCILCRENVRLVSPTRKIAAGKCVCLVLVVVGLPQDRNKWGALFDVLLTVHLSIILVINQLDAQILVL